MPEHSFTCWALEGGEGGGEYELLLFFFFFLKLSKHAKKRLKIAMFISQGPNRDFTPKWCGVSCKQRILFQAHL